MSALAAAPRHDPAPRAFVSTARAFLGRAAEWDSLVARAIEPNPHFSARVVGAHLAHGLAEADLQVLHVEAEGRLLALVPFRIGGGLVPGGRVASPFASRYVTGAAPLVAGGPDTAPALAGLVEGLALASDGQPWRWPLLPADGAVGAALLAALTARGWAAAAVSEFPRAVLDRRPDLAALHAARPGRDRTRDIARRRRRLSERGRLTHESAEAGPALAAAIEAFLALEGAGWKGERGTAMACRPATAAFARALFADAAGPVRPRADLLRLDGRPVAVSLALVAGRVTTLLKTAYDESLARYAPGLLLEEAMVEALHATAFADRLDSASKPGSVLEDLYPDRERIADLVLVPPAAGADAAVLARRARWRHLAGDRARRAIEGLRTLARRAPARAG